MLWCIIRISGRAHSCNPYGATAAAIYDSAGFTGPRARALADPGSLLPKRGPYTEEESCSPKFNPARSGAFSWGGFRGALTLPLVLTGG